MISLHQRILDIQSQIFKLERNKLEQISLDVESQNLSIPEIKALIKTRAQEEYKRHALAAAIAVCLELSVEDAIALADELRLKYPAREDLEQLVLGGQIFPLLQGTRLGEIAWQRFEDALSEKPGATGDGTCRFNARSAYIRCAVNPLGPCSGCGLYEEEED